MARTLAGLQLFRMGKEDSWAGGKGASEEWIGLAPDAFDLGLKPEVSAGEKFTGTHQRLWAGITGVDLKGKMTMQIWPENAEALLDWVCARTNGELVSYEIQRYTGQEYLSYKGVKVSRATIEASEGSHELTIAYDLQGEGEGACSTFDGPSLPARGSFLFGHGTVYFGSDDDNYSEEGQCMAVKITVNNNLKPSRHDGEDGLIEWLDAGPERVDIESRVRMNSGTYQGWLRGGKEDMAFKVMFDYPGTVPSGDQITIEVPEVTVTGVGYSGKASDVIDLEISGEGHKGGDKDQVIVTVSG